MRWTALFALAAVAACFDPTKSTGDEGSDTGSGDSGPGTTAPTTSATTTNGSATSPTTTVDDTTSATTSVDDTTTTPTTGDDVLDTTTGGGGVTICDQGGSSLAACEAAFDGTPTYGTLGCDNTVVDFSIFYEDVFEIDLLAGQCLYAWVDNVGEAGATGANAADVALQVRSPSGAYGFRDDDVACTDPTWTGGGACPQALFTADVDGPHQLSIVQASGSGCVSGAPYRLIVAIDGVELVPALYLDDQLTDCTP